MKLYDGGIVFIIAVVLVAGAIGYGSSKLLKKDDNIVEEKSEEVIKHYTGFDVDLTPSSPE